MKYYVYISTVLPVLHAKSMSPGLAAACDVCVCVVYVCRTPNWCLVCVCVCVCVCV